jgi:hypothetical protein
VPRGKYEGDADRCVNQREKREERGETSDNVMENRERFSCSVSRSTLLTLASLFRLDPAIDQLLQHIQRDAAIAQDDFIKLPDIKFIA